MSKRSITFNKPEDPSFLKQLKASIGYKEGPSVDTKRQKLEEYDSEEEDWHNNDEDRPNDLKPQVVVLKPGDLTAEEATREKERLEREEQQKPADLSQRILFKKPKKEETTDQEASKDIHPKDPKRSKSKQKGQGKLSFSHEDNDDDGEEDEG